LERVRIGLQRTWVEESIRWTFSSDKYGDPLLLFAHWPAHGDVWLFVTAALHNARSMMVIVHVEGDDAELVDMQGSEHVNRGIGTAALAFVEQLLCELGVRKIHGWLSPEDLDHRPRQRHFYAKNGYKVTIEPEHVDGQIEKQLICGKPEVDPLTETRSGNALDSTIPGVQH
jgi:GNAT superfamily N-acetyltransferase